jgi:hypothetical protein
VVATASWTIERALKCLSGVLGRERIIEDRLGSIRLPEGYKAGALVVANVEPIVTEIHAVSAFVGLGSVQGTVGQVLRLAECRRVADPSVGTCLQRRQPCLDGQVCSPASVTLSSPNEFERSGVIAAIGRKEALPSKQPTS